MADVNRLKKKAAEFEAKRQFERAIGVYEQIVLALGSKVREADVPLFNRLGDLYLRVGQAEHGTAMHEKAVDLYAELGFFNNAIALCNKILRQEPTRTSIYYKLGKISAKKGFISDAKQNFLEYSSRMQKSGQMDEAFRALKEFADLCPDQDDVRLSLAEQLVRADKPVEALEQLQLLHQQLRTEGRDAEAAATVERMRAIDPNVVPREPNGRSVSGRGDLVFLDLDEVSESATKTARVDGFEPTAFEGDAGALRLLTPKEFGATQFPSSVEPEREFRTTTGYLAGLPVLDDYESTQLAEEVPEAAQVEEPLPVYEQEPESLPAAEVADDGPVADQPADVAEVEPPAADFGAVETIPFSAYYEEPTGFEPGDSGFPSLPALAEEDQVEDDVGTEPEYAASETAPEPVAEPEAPGDDLVEADPVEADFAEPDPAEPDLAEPDLAEPDFAAPAPPEPAAAPSAGESSGTRARPDDELVDLGEWLREIQGPPTTRMIADEGRIPPEGEQADFDEMLEKFKQGIAENMDADDHGSHYDLGVAFREMGLLDEAIAQFQRALRGRENRVATYEALGQCFVDKRQYEVATTVLQRALREPEFEDDRGLGVLYLLGLANERMSRPGEAARYYQRVFSVDINFRDIADRRNAVAKAGG